MTRSRLLVLGALALALASFVALDLGRFVSLTYLQASQAGLAELYAQAPWAVRGAYFALYVAVASLSLPGAAILTLAGGGVFGLGWGLLLVSFASTLGATASFLAARFVLRDAVQARFGERLAGINQGVARDGALYLFSLRLIPVVPFFVINLAMGLTPLRTWTFYWVSQLGMLAGTAVYVNAGTQLASIAALRDVASPGLLGALALLGLFPLLAKAVMQALQRRRVYARWHGQRPRRFDRNLIVIGAGAGGLVSAYIAAAVKARVTLVEAHIMGGDCLNYGCVPSKALIKSARVAQQMRDAGRFGLQGVAPTVNFPAVMERIQAVIAAIAPHDSVARYTALGVEVLHGHATLCNPWTVEIRHPDGSTQRLSARSIVIAAGARPLVPPLPGLAEAGYVTSDTLWARFATLPAAPARLLVLGGGPIGCELAQSFARLGSQVTLVEQAPRLLAREDDEVAALVLARLQAEGVRVLTGHTALRCETGAEGRALMVAQQGQTSALPFDELLCAVGRVARLDGYGLEALGIPTGRTIETNAYLETLYPNIYAVGDVAGPYQFTHAAAHQAWYATVNALFGQFRRFKADYRALPAVTFTEPEVARVGLNEQGARAQGIAYELTRYPLDDLDRAIAEGETEGFVKVLTVPGQDRILGVTIVGSHAGELLAEYVLAMQQGLGLNKILGTIHPYPTLAEANKYAAGAWKRAHAPERLLAWVRRYHDWRRG
ncbi:MAG: pyridine nucleotide-disulfide oxidoreductase [Rhodoferax sp.]|nr:pyridine nucleotide-disulfide oxidoreductase [Rhodoferax sp.]